jgi:DNA gyrase subunit A
LKVTDARVMGRATQGVRLINLGKRNDQIASVCKVLTSNEEEELEIEEGEVVGENVMEINTNDETEELINDNE